MTNTDFFELYFKDVIFLSKRVMKECGVKSAVFLAELVSIEQEQGEKGNFFECTIEEMQTRTNLTRHEQDTAIKNLVNAGYISTCNLGVPCKRQFKINNCGGCKE